MDSIPSPTRTNEELNLAVLRRHNPVITSILSLAPYAVVYLFSATTQLWEKSGIEGTLFVCQLTQGDLGEERYSVLVLNRRGMNNFEANLASGEDVELTEEYVILRVDGQNSGGRGEGGDGQTSKTADSRESMIYGLWIFSEPLPSSTAETRALNAQVIKECAVHGGESKKFAAEQKFARERLAAERNHHPASGTEEGAHSSVPMGRQISLKELFGQQRAQDDEWSVKVHSPSLKTEDSALRSVPPRETESFQSGDSSGDRATSGMQSDPGKDILGDLFRRAGVGHYGAK
jgi:hypothetical protein